MSAGSAAVTTLRRLIGRQVRYQDTAYTVVEVLDHGPTLVLEPLIPHSSIQADDLGFPRRQMPDTLAVCVGDADGVPDLGAAGVDVI